MSLQKEAFEVLKKFCASSANPVFFTNSDKEILFCSDCELFTSKNLDIILDGIDFSYHEKGFSHSVSIDGNNYRVYFNPAEGIFLCEVVRTDEADAKLKNNPIFKKYLPFLDGFEHNIAMLWNAYNPLSGFIAEKELEDERRLIEDMRKRIVYIDKISKNLFEYANMTFGINSINKFEVCTTAEGIIERSNVILKYCGRRIEFLRDSERYAIEADRSHFATAFINILQNALFYSPAESEPLVTISVINEVVHICVTNEISGENLVGRKAPDLSIPFQRIGIGFPVVEEFAKESKGVFETEVKNGRMKAVISVPAAKINKNESYLRQSSYVYYNTGVPDIVDLAMFEVVDYFGGNYHGH